MNMLNEFRQAACKSLLRSGKILYDKTWQEPEGEYQGANRALEINYLGRVWFVEQCNGLTTSITSCPE